MLDLRHFSQIPQNAQKQEEAQKKDNQRTRLTKRLLRESLLDLLQEKSPDHITVKELCEAAELNRSTFYAYYTDVFALYEEMGNELVDGLIGYIQDIERVKGIGFSTEPMLQYIRDNQEMFHLLVYCDHYTEGNQAVHMRIARQFFAMPLQTDPNLSREEQEYVLRYMYMGGTGVIHRWVQNGCDLPSAKVAALLDNLIMRTLGDL